MVRMTCSHAASFWEASKWFSCPHTLSERFFVHLVALFYSLRSPLFTFPTLATASFHQTWISNPVSLSSIRFPRAKSWSLALDQDGSFIKTIIGRVWILCLQRETYSVAKQEEEVAFFLSCQIKWKQLEYRSKSKVIQGQLPKAQICRRVEVGLFGQHHQVSSTKRGRSSGWEAVSFGFSWGLLLGLGR